MGTLVDKLEKLMQTKEAIRQALIAKGCDVPEDMPFGDYPSVIESIVVKDADATE